MARENQFFPLPTVGTKPLGFVIPPKWAPFLAAPDARKPAEAGSSADSSERVRPSRR